MANPGRVHEKAIAMLERALYGAYAPGRRERGVGEAPVYSWLHPGAEEFSDNLAAGVVKVKIPGEWDSVGGVIPDLILYGADDAPVRIIEVIDTSAPDKAKRDKLDRIARRGVDVVELEVHTDDDLPQPVATSEPAPVPAETALRGPAPLWCESASRREDCVQT